MPDLFKTNSINLYEKDLIATDENLQWAMDCDVVVEIILLKNVEMIGEIQSFNVDFIKVNHMIYLRDEVQIIISLIP